MGAAPFGSLLSGAVASVEAVQVAHGDAGEYAVAGGEDRLGC